MFYIMNYKQEFKIDVKPLKHDHNVYQKYDITTIPEKHRNSIYTIINNNEPLVKLFHKDIDFLTDSIVYTILNENNNSGMHKNKIIFSNSKNSFVFFKYNTMFVINCFHMNTLTFKVFKNLIYELKTYLINCCISEQIYKAKSKTKDRDVIYSQLFHCKLILFNFCSLETQKQNVFYNVFSNAIPINNIMFKMICCQRFYDNADTNFFYGANNSYPKLHDTTHILTYANCFQAPDSISNNSLINLSNRNFKNVNEKIFTIRNEIQHVICNVLHSNNLLVEVYKNAYYELIKQNKPINKFVCLNKYFKDARTNLKTSATKHIIYENFVHQYLNLLLTQ